MSLAIVFPGQGSQSVGMLAELAARHPEVEATFAEASEALGYDLWALVRNGPAERLNETVHTQPAMLAAGVATWRCWQSLSGPSPMAMAGHSLGEFSALVCAQSLGFSDAVRVVQARAQLMQAAVPIGQGGIAALLGLDDGAVESLCETVRSELAGRSVTAVNYNAPGQVVVAGHGDAVDAVVARARDAGARRAIKLPMSVPVHCPLMAPAAEGFNRVLAEVSFLAPQIPVLHNADLAAHDDPAAIRTALVGQLVKPVRWTGSIVGLREMGARRFVELGPGKVLSGLLRRIDRSAEGVAVLDPQSLDAAVSMS